jgi:hypothetical protein
VIENGHEPVTAITPVSNQSPSFETETASSPGAASPATDSLALGRAINQLFAGKFLMR